MPSTADFALTRDELAPDSSLEPSLIEYSKVDWSFCS